MTRKVLSPVPKLGDGTSGPPSPWATTPVGQAVQSSASELGQRKIRLESSWVQLHFASAAFSTSIIS